MDLNCAIFESSQQRRRSDRGFDDATSDVYDAVSQLIEGRRWQKCRVVNISFDIKKVKKKNETGNGTLSLSTAAKATAGTHSGRQRRGANS
jgi:hypothetical protein